MSLYSDWRNYLENLTDDQAEGFQHDYYEQEEKLYQKLLAQYPEKIEGTFQELTEKYEFKPMIFAGFMDGINDSLNNPYKLEDLKEDTKIVLDVDFEKLYANMLEAKAAWLYNLDEWNNVFSKEKRQEITKQYHLSKQAVSHKIDRNAPCPCGSGKKYKKCCGKNA